MQPTPRALSLSRLCLICLVTSSVLGAQAQRVQAQEATQPSTTSTPSLPPELNAQRSDLRAQIEQLLAHSEQTIEAQTLLCNNLKTSQDEHPELQESARLCAERLEHMQMAVMKLKAQLKKLQTP